MFSCSANKSLPKIFHNTDRATNGYIVKKTDRHFGHRPHQDAAVEPTDDSVAVLLQAPGAVWDTTDVPPRVGAPLRPGRIHLKAGTAHIEFYSGATVILQGPAEFELVSQFRANCTLGKLRATVPPAAQGFVIGAPHVDLVDRGTEFGLTVGVPGAAGARGDQTEWCGRGVELTATVIREGDRLDTGLGREHGVVDALDPLDHDRTVPDRTVADASAARNHSIPREQL